MSKYLRVLSTPVSILCAFLIVLNSNLSDFGVILLVGGLPFIVFSLVVIAVGSLKLLHLALYFSTLISVAFACLIVALDQFLSINVGGADIEFVALIFGLCTLIGYFSVDGTEIADADSHSEIEWYRLVEGNAVRKKAVLQKLSSDAESMKRLSFYSLAGLGGVIFIAVLMVLFAGAITNIDLSGTSKTSMARNYLEQMDINYLEDTMMLNELKSQARVGQDASPSAEYERRLAELRDAQRRSLEFRDRAMLIYERAISEEMGLQDSSSAETQLGSAALTASAVTRFGVVVVLMFFAQALVGLYRYSLRLASSYETRAIAIALCNDELDDLETIAAVVSSDHVDMVRNRSGAGTVDELQKILNLLPKAK